MSAREASSDPVTVDPALAAAFPFYIACDADARVSSVGHAIAKLDRGVVGAPFSERFDVLRPSGGRDILALASTPHALVMLRTREGMTLRGQVLPCGRGVVFVGSPSVESVDEVRRFGLTVDDFAAHDSVVDYIVLLDQVRSQLRESNELAARLSAEIRAAERLRDEAREATARAVDAARAKEQFLASMSHELRTPLTTILAANQLLLAAELSAEQREHALAQQSAAESLLALIHSVLDHAKLQSGRFDLSPEPFEPRRVLHEALAPLRESAERRSLVLEWIASEYAPTTVRGDPVRFRQVISNLVSNALKFTERGGVLVRLSVAQRDGDRVRLAVTVSDTGRGIAPEALATLFRPFVQAHDDRREGLGGSGLGLSICRQIAELMGGTTSATSTPGVGSTFTFEGWFEQTQAPRARHTAAFRPLAPRASVVPPKKTHDPPLVLVVEDNPVNRRLLALLVESLGYLVDTAVDGRSALAALTYGGYRAVLMDCSMTGMDGFEATRALRALPGAVSKTPVIAVTAHALEGDRQRCLDAGMDDYLTKPVSPPALLEVLSRWAPISQSDHDSAAVTALDERARDATAPVGATVDPTVLGALRKFQKPGAPDLVEEVFALFETDARERAKRLVAAATDRDEASMVAVAHALRGASASVGARKVERLARWLDEHASVTTDWALRRDLAATIAAEVETTITLLGAWTRA